jgi:hypothetical protein
MWQTTKKDDVVAVKVMHAHGVRPMAVAMPYQHGRTPVHVLLDHYSSTFNQD